jgi:hypothetical protein
MVVGKFKLGQKVKHTTHGFVGKVKGFKNYNQIIVEIIDGLNPYRDSKYYTGHINSFELIEDVEDNETEFIKDALESLIEVLDEFIEEFSTNTNNSTNEGISITTPDGVIIKFTNYDEFERFMEKNAIQK